MARENGSPINLQLHPTASLYEVKSNRNPVLQTAVTNNYVYTAATVSGGVNQFNKSSLTFEKTILFDFPPKSNQSLFAVETWGADTVICGTDAGLFLYNEKRNTSNFIHLPGWNTSRYWVSNLFVDSKKTLWITTNKSGGCYFWEAGKKLPEWFEINLRDKEFKVVHHVAEDAAGNIWFAGQGILRYNRAKKLIDYYRDSFSELYDEPVHIDAIAVDNLGKVWAANGSSGLACLDPASNKIDLYNVKDGLIDEGIIGLKYFQGSVIITSKNGILKIDCRSKKIKLVATIKDVNYQNFYSGKMAYDYKSNSFYTGAGSSVIKFDSGSNNRIPNNPTLLLVFVKLGNDSITWFPKADITVSWKNRNITLFYNSINFEDADNQKYAYRTIRSGKVSKWSMESDQRRIIFSNLEQGTTTVEWKVFSPQNVWQAKTIKTIIHVIAPFWKTNWFFLSCIVVFFTGFWLFLKQRDKQAKKIMAIKTNISKDLHDEIGATLSGISMYGHMVKSSLDKSEISAANHAANIIQISAADMVTKLNDIIWLINPGKESLADLILKLKEIAQNLSLARGISAEVKIIGSVENCKLPIQKRKNIYLFCREAINNSVKYSLGTSLFLEFILHDNILKVTIRDNGVGFNMNEVRKGNGLDNMQKRAEEMGAQFFMKSEPAQGCLITIALKITQ